MLLANHIPHWSTPRFQPESRIMHEYTGAGCGDAGRLNLCHLRPIILQRLVSRLTSAIFDTVFQLYEPFLTTRTAMRSPSQAHQVPENAGCR